MRKILFRGRCVQDGKWVYGVPIFSKDDDQIAYLLQNFGEYVVQAKTVGEFIGLKDKNKTEIYEGDILHGASTYGGEEYTYVVKYVPTDNWTWNFPMELCNMIRVLGNVHDNPDLLIGLEG